MTKARKMHIAIGLVAGLAAAVAFLCSQTAEAPTVNHHSQSTNTNMPLSLTSSAFSDGEMIPATYTCDGNNTNPPLSISGVPEGTQSLVLVMDDPDIPQAVKDARGIDKFDHWVVYALSPETTALPADMQLGSLGNNSVGEAAYTGPCPPTQYEPTTHRYIFRLYALSSQLNFLKTPTLDEVEEAAKAQAIATAELTGLYTRAE